MSRRTTEFQTIRSEGGLLPPDLLRRVVDPAGKVSGVESTAYGLPAGERINEAITQSWNRLRRYWSEFRAAVPRTPSADNSPNATQHPPLPESDAFTGLTNDKWSLPLLRELGFGFLTTTAGPTVDGKTYAISRFAGSTPIHLVGCGVSLDRRAAGVRGAAQSNPHGLVQEFLNRSDAHLWAIVSNGLAFRILRDNQALSRQSFLEFDLEAMFDGEVYSDFVLLWLVTHATRFLPRNDGRPESCWLETWTKEAAEQGVAALTDLRGGVEKALEVLGQGFVGHPRNTALREALRKGEISLSDFHGQLLRIIYRLIFLFVAEDRELEGIPLLHPQDKSDQPRLARERYAAHYSTSRLRELASRIKGSRHADLWRQFQLLVGALSGEDRFASMRATLALPPLGSMLWNPASTALLNGPGLSDPGAELSNVDFLEALRHLAFIRKDKILRPVDYKNLGSEEFGGVYESFLALTPQISSDGSRFTFAEFAGNERKTSGSYYTSDSLVQCLLDSALDPVVEARLADAERLAKMDWSAVEKEIQSDPAKRTYVLAFLTKQAGVSKYATAEERKRAWDSVLPTRRRWKLSEEGILAIKVCDKAVGSGHFLVGAGHRLARHLARVRALAQGESEPSPLLYQTALRDVIGHCVYGVDINPMTASYVPAREPTRAELAHADDLVLVVGVITDSDHARQFRRLLHQLLRLQTFDQVCSLDVVTLHNGGPQKPIEDMVADHRARGLTIFLASEKQQRDDSHRGAFGQGFVRPEGRAPIGPARTMLQTYVTRVANQREGAIAWILDDDSSFENVCDGENPPAFTDLLASLKKIQSFGVDVVLGTVTGDPPVPPGSTVRTQLVDLYHNLAWLQSLPPLTDLPNRAADNREARHAARDFYYDLSRRDTHHLEWPFWLTPSHPGETVHEAAARMLTLLPRILAGQAVFRPLLLELDHDAVASMRPSVQRGTNTFAFNLAAFIDFPNAAPQFAGSSLRRSDMIWALLNRYAGGRRIVSATLPIRHDRADEPPVGLDFARLLPDMRGYSLYSAIEDVLVHRRERRLRNGIGAEHPDDLKFRESDLDFAVARFRKYLTERTAALILSCWRIQGLCKAIARLPSPSTGRKELEDLGRFLDQTRSCFDPTRVQTTVEGAPPVAPEEIKAFLRSLPALVENHRRAPRLLSEQDTWFHAEREASARALALVVRGTDDLRLLGTGSEGVVFASSDTVIKIIDYSKRSPANGAREGLARLAASTVNLSSLYRPRLPNTPGSRQIISYPFEPSEPYRGGLAADLLQILRDCLAAGIVTTNLHPKNLAVTPAGARLIDYGSDIRWLTQPNFISMVHRAWLTLRHHDRQDLAALMRRALDDDSIPELEGWEAMLAAVDAPSKREVVDDALLDLLRGWKSRKVLDFGCGHGRLAAALAAEGAEVTAFDPDESLRSRWNQLAKHNSIDIRWLSGTAEQSLSGLNSTFDTVVCSLVLCVIEPIAEYRAALQSISKALSARGRFVIAVCNPEVTFDGDTTIQRRMIPPGASASETFAWEKGLPSGNLRHDVHRPLASLMEDLAAVGLSVTAITTTGGLSLDTFQPSHDFLIVRGVKADGPNALQAIFHHRKPRSLRCPAANPPVLCYHRVLPVNYNDLVSPFQRQRGTVVDLDVFKHQLDEIRRFFSPVSLNQYLRWLYGDTDLPQNACLITFDDATRDFLDFAWPALRSSNTPCALFSTTSAAKGEELLPTDRLYASLSQALREGRLGASQIPDWVTGASKQRYLRAPVNDQRRILHEAGLAPAAISPSDLYLSEAELANLPPDLVGIGGHGYRHELLADKGLTELRAELRRVRFWLEHLAAFPTPQGLAIAYPNGAHGPNVRAATIEAGFAAAFTVIPWRPGRADHRWCLRRSCVPNRLNAVDDLVAGKELRI